MFYLSEFKIIEKEYIESLPIERNLTPILAIKIYNTEFYNKMRISKNTYFQYDNDNRKLLTRNEYLLLQNMEYINTIVPKYSTYFFLSFFDTYKEFIKHITSLREKGYLSIYYVKKYKKYKGHYIVDSKLSDSKYKVVDIKGIAIRKESKLYYGRKI